MDDSEESRQSKGGKARRDNLSPERRREIALNAAESRWANVDPEIDLTKVPIAICGGPDKPLRIDDVELPCFVLEGGKRVIHQRGMVSALGMSRGGSSRGGGDRLAYFVAQKTLSPYVSSDLLGVTAKPLVFKTPKGSLAYGYEATVLAEICEAILKARSAGDLGKQQGHIADKAEVLIRAFARVGIIALVDEATGYQEVRAKDDLQKILAAYISPSLLPWSEKFPIDFFKEMFRVWGWPWPAYETYRGPLGPRYAGKLIKQLILENLPPGVLEELEKRNPPNDKWQRKNRMGQFLTDQIGHPHVEKLVSNMTMLFRMSENRKEFWKQYSKAFGKPGPLFEMLD